MSRSFVPPAGPPRVLAVAQLADSVGLGGYLVSAALYFTTIAGLTPTELGLGLSVGWGLGMVAGTPLGHLADRVGPRQVAVGLAVATGLAMAAFLLVGSSLGLFIAVACLFASGQSGLSAARQALLAALVDPAQRTAVRAHLQSVTNAGLALGSALGGVALYIGTSAAYFTVFGLAAVTYGLSALVLLRLPSVPPVPSVHGEPRLAVLRDRPYVVVSVLHMILLLQLPMLSIAVPLWIVLRTESPGWMVSALLVLNMVAVALFQVRVARRVHDLRSANRSVALAGAVLLAACAVFAASSQGGTAWVAALVLLAGAALQVLGEMLLSSGAWEISFGLAPDGKHGQYQGFFGSGLAAARAIGPLLLTTLTITWGWPGWLLLGGLFLSAGLAMTFAVRWADRARAVIPAPAPA
jgi:MFS family permease